MYSARSLRRLATAALVTVALGCSDFLTGNGLTDDPNNPAVATRDQLFVAVQAAQFGEQQGNVAILSCLYMQQCSGVGNFAGAWDFYAVSPPEVNGDFANLYTGGGFIDIRRVEQGARASGDSVYVGVAKIWEALIMSFAADNWGDVPYSQAYSGSGTPAFDDQMAIYASLQTLLDEAISDLTGPGEGPGDHDLVYLGDTTAWREAAYTLKARLYMHTAERVGTAAYTSAIAAANKGISSPANDLRSFHGTAPNEANMWFQLSQSGVGQFVVAGKTLVDLMAARSDPRLPQYFGQNVGGGFGGNDVNGATSADSISGLDGTREVPTFRQPILTFDENQLILAEAKFQTTGAVAAAGNLNTVRGEYGQGVIAVPTLAQIMTEKYIGEFQSAEAWQDYKRTCLPTLTPADGVEVPGRLWYGITEMSANPNTPSIGEQLSQGGVAGGRPGVGGFRNPNDPNACP